MADSFFATQSGPSIRVAVLVEARGNLHVGAMEFAVALVRDRQVPQCRRLDQISAQLDGHDVNLDAPQDDIASVDGVLFGKVETHSLVHAAALGRLVPRAVHHPADRRHPLCDLMS